jgi:hypothetical protein
MACVKDLVNSEKVANKLLVEMSQELWLSGFPVPLCAELEKRLHEETKKYFDEILKR